MQNQKAPIKDEMHRLRSQINDLNHSLQLCKRHDAQYLDLLKEWGEMNQREAEVQIRYEKVDEDSRNLFDAYKDAVMRSYAQERVQQTQFKYFTLMFSLISGGLFTMVTVIFRLVENSNIKRLQKTIAEQELVRQADTEKLEGQLQEQKALLISINNQRREVVNLTTTTSSSTNNSLYSWIAWACRPLKFW